MKLAGKYMEFAELLSPQIRAFIGAADENLTINQKQRLEEVLRKVGTAPPGSNQAIEGQFELDALESEIAGFSG